MTRLRQAGFSLLEMLVALFVIVIVTSLVSLTISSGGQDIELEAQVRNLSDVAVYALDEAQFQGLDYGLLLRRDLATGEAVYRYDWRERTPEGWRPPESGKDVFAGQALPPGFELQLELEDSAVTEFSLVGEEVEAPPQIVFYASGETTEGTIDVLREPDGELLWRVQWDLLGRFTVQLRGEESEEDLE